MKSRYAVVASTRMTSETDRAKKGGQTNVNPFQSRKVEPPLFFLPWSSFYRCSWEENAFVARRRSAARYGQALLVSRKKKVLMRSEQYRRPPSDDGDTSVLSSPIYFLLMHIFIQVQEFTDIFLTQTYMGTEKETGRRRYKISHICFFGGLGTVQRAHLCNKKCPISQKHVQIVCFA